MSEYASKKTRGMMVMLVFTMQAGLVFGPLLAAALLTTHLLHDLDLAPPARLRGGSGDGGLPDAAAHGRDAALSARH